MLQDALKISTTLISFTHTYQGYTKKRGANGESHPMDDIYKNRKIMMRIPIDSYYYGHINK